MNCSLKGDLRGRRWAAWRTAVLRPHDRPLLAPRKTRTRALDPVTSRRKIRGSCEYTHPCCGIWTPQCGACKSQAQRKENRQWLSRTASVSIGSNPYWTLCDTPHNQSIRVACHASIGRQRVTQCVDTFASDRPTAYARAATHCAPTMEIVSEPIGLAFAPTARIPEELCWIVG